MLFDVFSNAEIVRPLTCTKLADNPDLSTLLLFGNSAVFGE